MFLFGYNWTSEGQTFYDKRRNPLRVPSHYAIDLSLLNGGWYHVLRPTKNFLNDFVEDRVTIQRTFSLGDVLMLVPVIRELERMGIKVSCQTDEKYVPLLRLLGVNSIYMDRNEGPGIILDWVIERDHSEKELQKMHRVNIYALAIGMKDFPNMWNWGCDLGCFPEADPWSGENYVVFQGLGAARQRGLSAETIQWILDAFAVEEIKVVYIGEPIDLRVNEKFIKLQFLNNTLPQLFSVIGRARCVISMDSSPLWVSHFVKTPVIAILGPSRKEERISLHPLAPEGVIAIELNKEINCESCFEHAEVCEKRFDCLKKVEPDRLYELIRPYVFRYLNVENNF